MSLYTAIYMHIHFVIPLQYSAVYASALCFQKPCNLSHAKGLYFTTFKLTRWFAAVYKFPTQTYCTIIISMIYVLTKYICSPCSYHKQ